MNDDPERIWKETVMMCVNVLYQSLLGGAEENLK
jgi:hypothetical protein